MKKLTTKILSLILSLSMMLSLSVPAFATEFKFEPNESITIIGEVDSSFGKVYYIKDADSIQPRSFWDITDIVMSGVSWAEFFGEPSFKNLGWAVLDTVSIAPIIPSSAYIRRFGKKVLDPDLLKAAMKASPSLKGKLLKALKGASKAEASAVVNALRRFNSKMFYFGKHKYLLDKSTMKHILTRHHPAYWNGTIKANQSFFSKKTSIDDIINIINSVMKQNRDILVRAGNGSATFTGRHNGQLYQISIRNGRITQFYPK